MTGSSPKPDPLRPRGIQEPALVPANDDAPYAVVGGEERKCPKCGKPLTPEAVTCGECGVNLRTGKKPARVFKEIERRWEAGYPYRTRLRLFWAAQALILGTGLIGAALSGSFVTFLFSWIVFTGLLAFVLGTFDRLDLTRNKKGRVSLTKTWRIFFLREGTTKINLGDYEGIVTRGSCDADAWDWAILIILLMAGGVPGIVWWFISLHRVTYQVALSKDHGYPAMILYRGWDEDHMRDIAKTVCDVGDIPNQSI